MKAIIVEDAAPTLQLLGTLLRQIPGVRVVGQYLLPGDALKNCAISEPDAAFLDIELPDMDGIELARRLRQQRPDIAIVFVTSYAHYAVEAFGVQAIDYLLKPFDQAALVRAVGRIQARLKAKETAVNSDQMDPDRVDTAKVTASHHEISSPGTASADSDTPRVRVNLFGGFEVFTPENIRVRWPSRKYEEMLIYLLVTEQAISKWILIDMLWPNSDEKKAEKNFNMALYQIRQVIVQHKLPITIEVDKGRYRAFTGSEADFDLRSVRQIAQTKNPLRRTEDQALLERAYRACTEDFLAGTDYSWFWKFSNVILQLQQTVIQRYWENLLSAGQRAQAHDVMRRAMRQFADDEVMLGVIEQAIG